MKQSSRTDKGPNLVRVPIVCPGLSSKAQVPQGDALPTGGGKQGLSSRMPGNCLHASRLLSKGDLGHGEVGGEASAGDPPDLHRLVLAPGGKETVVVGGEGKVGDEGGVAVDPWHRCLVWPTLG